MVSLPCPTFLPMKGVVSAAITVVLKTAISWTLSIFEGPDDGASKNVVVVKGGTIVAEILSPAAKTWPVLCFSVVSWLVFASVVAGLFMGTMRPLPCMSPRRETLTCQEVVAPTIAEGLEETAFGRSNPDDAQTTSPTAVPAPSVLVSTTLASIAIRGPARFSSAIVTFALAIAH